MKRVRAAWECVCVCVYTYTHTYYVCVCVCICVCVSRFLQCRADGFPAVTIWTGTEVQNRDGGTEMVGGRIEGEMKRARERWKREEGGEMEKEETGKRWELMSGEDTGGERTTGKKETTGGGREV